MQLSIYYQKEDEYLFDKVEKLAKKERRSKSAALLSILEEYFEAGKGVGEILKDMHVISTEQLHEALSIQRNSKEAKRLGEIMLEKNFIDASQLERALGIQQASQDVDKEKVALKKERIS
ncbi:hypothetical protein KGY71_04715 [Candidatus Bipolaricaulota bacterium]|nr:hypothetical protein [Candidatus Bipolaricaulota bacterium]